MPMSPLIQWKSFHLTTVRLVLAVNQIHLVLRPVLLTLWYALDIVVLVVFML